MRSGNSDPLASRPTSRGLYHDSQSAVTTQEPELDLQALINAINNLSAPPTSSSPQVPLAVTNEPLELDMDTLIGEAIAMKMPSSLPRDKSFRPLSETYFAAMSDENELGPEVSVKFAEEIKVSVVHYPILSPAYLEFLFLHRIVYRPPPTQSDSVRFVIFALQGPLRMTVGLPMTAQPDFPGNEDPNPAHTAKISTIHEQCLADEKPSGNMSFVIRSSLNAECFPD
ncbi:hypothetical protein CVT26_007585 [Gymnopilus dilepis]|uniref:Uncharacterized protein n=1 Tax=Gymnopilus dilepis TaxID=231916 RepID=A0A409WI86_9AGAR|nr:hypothetical protein CVT26_007585 [Gymnopilus dilepis]